MKNKFTKFAALLLLIIAANYSSADAQKLLYRQNFDDTVSVQLSGGPRVLKLPSDWSTNTSDSTWVPDSAKASSDTLHNSSKHAAMFLETNPGNGHPVHQHGDVIATFSGISTSGYKNITINFTERLSSKFPTSGNKVRVDFSINNGASWDSVPRMMTAGGNFDWTNGGTPLTLPAKAGNVSKLMVRFVGTIVANGGNYQFDDFMIGGTATTSGIENDPKAMAGVNAWYANNKLTINFNDNTPVQATINVYNMNGVQVYHQLCQTGGAVIVDAETFSPGMYITKVVTSTGNVFTNKFIK